MKIILRREAAQKIVRLKHPWIFRTAVHSCEGNIENGALAAVSDEDGKRIGTGFYSANGKIACRIFHWGETEPPSDWPERRLEEALRIRRSLAIDSDAFRLINAEGDFFPGLVIDVYGRTIVLKPSLRSVEHFVGRLADALMRFLPGSSVYLKRDEKAARAESLVLNGGYLSGGGDDTAVPMREGDIRYLVDVREGQKTGFYLDQRDNRRIIRGLAEGKRVLNLFSYTGAFAFAAFRGGAVSVDSVDSSPKALAGAERNFALNSFDAHCTARWIREDGFAFLDSLSAAPCYDMIILDPPPFARSRAETAGALRGYRRLQAVSLTLLSPGGLLAAFSCSGAVDADAFKRVLAEAAGEADRTVRILRELHAAPDHPWSIQHREGEYLKGLLAYVD